MPEQCELAGRELDAQVALLVGWKWVRLSGPEEIYSLRSPNAAARWRDALFKVSNQLPTGAQGITDEVPRYSTDANAALAAYGVMRERGWRLTKCHQFWTEDGWHVLIERTGKVGDEGQANGSTFAEALSRAIVAASASPDQSE